MKFRSAYYFCQALAVGCFVAGCAAPYDGGNRFEVKMTVVYADPDTINAEARYRGYRSQANGFFDPLRNELWCPEEESKEAFRTCGHELRHVVKGDFHGSGTPVLANRTISSGRHQSSEDRVGRPGQSTTSPLISVYRPPQKEGGISLVELQGRVAIVEQPVWPTTPDAGQSSKDAEEEADESHGPPISPSIVRQFIEDAGS